MIRASRAVLLALVSFGAVVGATSFVAPAYCAEWFTSGGVTTMTDQVGWSADGTRYSGTVSLRMESMTVSGQFKIETSIVSIVPEPGFTYTVKKSGGLDSPVEIQFTSATCQSTFKFLYKPGQTKIDGGVMRCR